MTTSVTWSGTRLSAEQIGYLTAGPGRAAETALARLIDGELVRVSRDGLVSAVHQNNHGAATAVEAQILAHARSGARFDTVVKSAAYSTAMTTLHQQLTDQGLLQRPRRRNEMWWAYFLIAGIVTVLGFSTPIFFLGVPVALLIGFRQRGRKAVTKAGIAALAQVAAVDRVHAVASYGFRGKENRRPIGDLYGLPQGIVKMLPRKKRRKSSSDGGGSSCGSGCGSCSCSSSSSSCSSGGSSCGGSGCGGGGGGGD